MKIIIVIPARYASTRFPGKPLVDLSGKPMVWWVYSQCKKVAEAARVLVATDDTRIADACKAHGMDYVMTRTDHPNHIERVQEVSAREEADWYICVNSDEPLIAPKLIRAALPSAMPGPEPFYGGLMREMDDPAEVVDFAKLKVAANKDGRCVYMSRSPVPYPRGTLLFKYKKYIGVECFNKAALDFFAATPMGELEQAEDIDHLRFLENGKEMVFTLVDSDSLSVDTPKDLEKVRQMMKETRED